MLQSSTSEWRFKSIDCCFEYNARDESVLFSVADGEESIFNPNCRTNILLEDIKRRCNCTKDGKFFRTLPNSIPVFINYYLCVNDSVNSRETNIHVVECFVLVTVDLSDESGNLKYLTDNPMSYATEILKERESFVLIRVESKLFHLQFPPGVYYSVQKLVTQLSRIFLSGLHLTNLLF